MVLPLILRGLALAAPIIARVIPKVASFILPKTLKQAVLTAATLPPLIGLATTPFGRKTISTIFSPISGFRRGRETPEFVSGIAEQIRAPTTRPSEFDLTEALKKAGLIGGGAALAGATIVGGRTIIERFRERETILGRGLPQAPFPITSQALAPVRKPPEEKPVVLEAMPQPKPVTIRNVFKPSIDISFKKSRRFINQQIHIK